MQKEGANRLKILLTANQLINDLGRVDLNPYLQRRMLPENNLKKPSRQRNTTESQQVEQKTSSENFC